MSENVIPIAFCFDENCLLPASIAIKSLLDSKRDSTEYKIFVLHNGISEENKNKFQKITSIEWIFVDDGNFNGCPINDIWPQIVYYRLLIPSLIKHYDKIIYSDIDVLFKKDLTEIYNLDLEESYWAGVIAEKNDFDTQCHKYFPENKNEFIYMSGFMLINAKKWRKENLFDKLIKNIDIFSDRLKFFDLDLLNITCNDIKSIPFNYCVLENIYHSKNITKAKEYTWLTKVYSHDELIQAKNNPAIIHYAGKNPKIWKRNKYNIPRYYWKYIIESQFYIKENYTLSFKYFWVFSMLFIISKFSFSKSKKREYRKKLNELYYCEKNKRV